jgi:hypothetical protein
MGKQNLFYTSEINFHGKVFVSSDDFNRSPDQSEDFVDCASGNDEAWINVSVDHDRARYCETLYAG